MAIKNVVLGWMALMLVAGGICSAADVSFHLSTADCKLFATVLKNKDQKVQLKFHQLSGTLTAGEKYNANVSVDLAGLDSGNPARDNNIRSAFFEISKHPGYQNAKFEMERIDGIPATLETGINYDAKAKGTLTIHGSSVIFEGPLVVKKGKKGSLIVQFKEPWIVNIANVAMESMLKPLKVVCPTHDSVGLNVEVGGELLFVPDVIKKSKKKIKA